MAAADRKAKKEIRYLEAEIQKWQILVDKVRGDNPPDFDNQTLAVLRGRLVRYLMRSREVRIKNKFNLNSKNLIMNLFFVFIL